MPNRCHRLAAQKVCEVSPPPRSRVTVETVSRFLKFRRRASPHRHVARATATGPVGETTRFKNSFVVLKVSDGCESRIQSDLVCDGETGMLETRVTGHVPHLAEHP